MIENAINKLDEVNGSSEESISGYIKANYDGLPWAHATYLRHHLNKLCEDGEIVLNSTSKCYTTSARAVLENRNWMRKRPTRVYFTFNGQRKQCGLVGVEEKGVSKRRRRCSALKGDAQVKGDANKVSGERKEFLGERPNETLAVQNANVSLVDEKCELEVTSEREDAVIENVDKSSSTLSIVPFGEGADIVERFCPLVICGLEVLSKQKQLVYSRKRLRARQEMNKVSSGPTPKRSKINNKVIPVSFSSALPVTHNHQMHNEIMFQTNPETETKFTVDENQHACGLGDGNIEQLERPEYLDPLHSSSMQELILMEDEESFPLQMVLESYSNQKQQTVQNAGENASLAPEVASTSHSKFLLEDLPNSEIPAIVTPVIVPDFLKTQREISSQPEANLIPDETGSMVCLTDEIKDQLGRDGRDLLPDVGSSDNMQVDLEKQQNQATTGSLMSGQSLQNHEHQNEDKERQCCEHEFMIENYEAPQLATSVEEISRSTSDQTSEEVKRKLLESLQLKKLILSPQNIEQKSKELKQDGRERPQIQPKKGGRGRPRKCLEVAQEDLVPLSIEHLLLQEGLSRPQHSKNSSQGGPQENLEAAQKDKEVYLNSQDKPEKLFEPKMSPKSQENLKLTEKNHRGKPKMLLESSPEQKFTVMKTRSRGRLIELAKEDPSSSSNLNIELRDRTSGSDGQPLLLANSRKKEKSGQGRLMKIIEETNIEDSATTNNLVLAENQQLKKDDEGGPLRQDRANKEDLAGLSDPMNVVQVLESVHDQEKEGKVDVCEQSEIEVQMTNLSDGSPVAEFDKSRSEVFGICETLVVPPDDDGVDVDDEQESQLAKNQEELKHCQKHDIDQREFKGQAELHKLDDLGCAQEEKEETDYRDPASFMDQLQINKEDSECLSQSESFAVDLKEGLLDLESEAKKPNLSDECYDVEPEKSQNEALWICETHVMPPSDDEKRVDQPGKGQEELHECDEQLSQEVFKGEAGIPKKKGRGRPCKYRKESDGKDPADSKKLDHQEWKQLRKPARGRPRKQKHVNREHLECPSDSSHVDFELPEIEAERPNLNDGSLVESEQLQSEVLDVCGTEPTVPLADDNKQRNKEQEELQHSHEKQINQGEFEGKAGVSKTKLEKVIVSSNYPLRSRMNL